ncbi:MBL fold metallo-hydrolase [Aquibacillus salsiterrae]|uniref:MBL fold metallo-hydrolase n=1 Tax=Aquibacillus salsiterrae TaxID=2950439 RepID=A0A9X3WDN0_9BACI|nr:MBL fold metallo-hydrolase [Aquibacillus salsiterrae]MDC3415514.1 MBL fold metallo-hydrolase [Aquibacillus salsiterrae]
MNISSLSLGPLGTNCYIVDQDSKAIIFDPGGDSEELLAWLTRKNLQPLAICLTHAHFDHIGAVDAIRNQYHIPVYLHQFESSWLSEPKLNGSALFPGPRISIKEADYTLNPGKLKIDIFDFEVAHTPGHSPGGVCFVFFDHQLVIGGDSLFYEGIGRTDLPGGDSQQLINSIKTTFFSLPDQFVVYPGHGNSTTIGHEKKSNPFVSE